MPLTLVTGGAGFLGAHVVNALLGAGHEVVVLDDLSGGNRANVNAGAAFVEASVTDGAALATLFGRHRFDYVFHLAAYAAEGLSHFIKRFNYMNNVIGSVNVINECVKHKVKCLVYTSSIAVYGRLDPPFREDMAPTPDDSYGVAKLAVEHELRVTHDMFGLDYVVFRPHNVYGELQNIGDRYRNVVGIFMSQLLRKEPLRVFGDGSQTRAFTYVGDVAPVIAKSVDVDKAYNQVFNIGSDEPVSVNALAERVMAAMGIPGEIRYLPRRHEVSDAHADHCKARAVFGDITETGLDDGLERMAAWAKKVGVRESARFKELEITEKVPPSWLEY